MDIIQVNDYYEVYDTYGKFVCSADNYREAEQEIKKYLKRKEVKRTYTIHYSAARGRWITKDGRKLQVPIEESHRHTTTVEAASPQAAINSIKLPGYIITNIQVA